MSTLLCVIWLGLCRHVLLPSTCLAGWLLAPIPLGLLASPSASPNPPAYTQASRQAGPNENMGSMCICWVNITIEVWHLCSGKDLLLLHVDQIARACMSWIGNYYCRPQTDRQTDSTHYTCYTLYVQHIFSEVDYNVYLNYINKKKSQYILFFYGMKKK